ncbi:GNAT family N-acetyltransferase [Loktanella agnita]|uniref:GNAT family N-acetyltransferase n=1 Tax=Loktanella agnita TaxID=287097 RepID=UPI003987DF73
MRPEIVIRPAEAADAAAISTLVCAVLYASNLPDYGAENVRRVAGHFTPEGVRHMLADGRVSFVATRGDRLVGTASYAPGEEAGTGVVKTFFVDSSQQRMGIGARLYDRIAAEAAKNRVSHFVVRASLAGVAFYEKLGFVPVQDHWDGTERTVEMRK